MRVGVFYHVFCLCNSSQLQGRNQEETYVEKVESSLLLGRGFLLVIQLAALFSSAWAFVLLSWLGAKAFLLCVRQLLFVFRSEREWLDRGEETSGEGFQEEKSTFRDPWASANGEFQTPQQGCTHFFSMWATYPNTKSKNLHTINVQDILQLTVGL